MRPAPVDAAVIANLVRAALAEDAPWGDASAALIDPSERARARLLAQSDGVLSGSALARAAFAQCDEHAQAIFRVTDGSAFAAGDTLATVTGPARALLRAERVALNFVQRMSGIATLTAQFVAAIDGCVSQHGNAVRIADTRKTTPGLRIIERQAVRDGGGINHRFSLSDAVLVKDNHLAVLARSGRPLTGTLRELLRELGHLSAVEVEVDSIDQLEPVLAAGVRFVLLDNFSPEDIRRALEVVAGRAFVEASGGVALENVREIASTGVDVISVGALTHSAPALDLSFDVDAV